MREQLQKPLHDPPGSRLFEHSHRAPGRAANRPKKLGAGHVFRAVPADFDARAGVKCVFVSSFDSAPFLVASRR